MQKKSSTFAVENPADRSVVAHVHDADVADASRAVDTAASSSEHWRRTPARERSELLHRAFDAMHNKREELADLICAENGKSRSDALNEVAYAADFFRWFAEEAVRSDSSAYGASPAGGTRTVLTQKPVGVTALVTPWNFPAAMVTRKVAPALAAGCTAVLKPAAETPLTALALADLLQEVGLPAGVLTVLTTTDAEGVVSSWLRDDRVRKISFTGSTAVGRILLRQAADRVVNCSMELGGNAPLVVDADADIDQAVHGALQAKFRGGGQACTAANRLYVHRDVAEEFVRRFGAAVQTLSVGPSSSGADIGPLISEKACRMLGELVDAAVRSGARITHQAPVPDGEGYFFAPTVLQDVAPNAAVLNEELFGPVAPIVLWEDAQTLVDEINRSSLGLAAYVFSGDLQRAIALAEEIDAGMVGINRGLISDAAAPFGGMKQSGLGREGGRLGLEEFTETQYLSIDWPDQAI